jgi:HK97 family phage prohead protease
MIDEDLIDEFNGDEKQMRAICQDIWDDFEKESDQENDRKSNNSLYLTKGNTEIKDIDNSKREVAIYLSKFGNIDSDNDVIQKGAFKKSLKERGVNSTGNRKIQFLRHHDWTKQIGSFVDLQEDDNGLFAIGKLGTSSIGEDAWRDYNEGIIREHSIGYQLVKSKWIKDETIRFGGYNLIQEVMLFEGSAVTFGANEMTETIGIVKGLKSDQEMIDDISEELSIVINALSKGQGSDERLYGLEMRAKYLSSRLSLLAKSQPFNENTEKNAEPMTKNDIDWSLVLSKINK